MLIFNLKKEWFEKIKSGEKTHEYREVKPHWTTRLRRGYGNIAIDKVLAGFKITPTDCVCGVTGIRFVSGYASKSDRHKRLYAKMKSIKITDGNYTDLKIDKPVYDIEFELIK